MNENVKDGNQQVPIQEQQATQAERKQSKETVTKSGLTLRELTIVGLLAAITIILGLSGYGIMALGPLNVTTLHVPALIGALVEGPKVGAFVGLIFGVYSFWQNFTAPNILSPLFINPLVSVVPRIIFPVLAVLVYKALWKAPQGPRLIVSAFMGTVFHTCMVMGLIYVLYSNMFAGTVFHTCMVMGLIYVLYSNMFAEAMHLTSDQVIGTILVLSVTHGIPEAIFAGVIVTPIALALRKALRKDVQK